MRFVLLWTIGISVLEMLMKSRNCLSGWLGILMHMRLVALIHTSHPLAFLIILLLCVQFAIILIMIVILVPIIFLVKALRDLAI